MKGELAISTSEINIRNWICLYILYSIPDSLKLYSNWIYSATHIYISNIWVPVNILRFNFRLKMQLLRTLWRLLLVYLQYLFYPISIIRQRPPFFSFHLPRSLVKSCKYIWKTPESSRHFFFGLPLLLTLCPGKNLTRDTQLYQVKTFPLPSCINSAKLIN